MSEDGSNFGTKRLYMRAPIPEIADAARYLDAAVSAHLNGRTKIADELIRLADMNAIRDWTESLWGKRTLEVHGTLFGRSKRAVPKPPKSMRRQPRVAQKRIVLERDGYHCRFCGIPVISADIRKGIRRIYPIALRWGDKNVEQHYGFQAMWMQYDHMMPQTRGGSNDAENIIITCAPCNYARMDYTLDEADLIDPRTREPIRSPWDGLERFIAG